MSCRTVIVGSAPRSKKAHRLSLRERSWRGISDFAGLNSAGIPPMGVWLGQESQLPLLGWPGMAE